MPRSRKDTNRKGEVAEVAFMERALRLGYVVSQPYGNSAAYDWVVGGAARRLRRVQVKSAWAATEDGRYTVPAQSNGCGCYTKDHIDVLAAYVAPAKAWYIIPVEAFAPRKRLCLVPDDPARDEWKQFREAWGRLGRIGRSGDREIG